MKAEIELNRDFVSRDEELLLSFLHTSELLERVSAAFLRRYDLTPTQFNALMIVRDYEDDGIKQSDLAKRLLINRASTGTLIDTLERRRLMERCTVPEDRRSYHLTLSAKARGLLRRLLKPYYARIEQVFSSFKRNEKASALGFMEKFREALYRELEALNED